MSQINLDLKAVDAMESRASPNYHVLASTARSTYQSYLRLLDGEKNSQSARQKETDAYSRIGQSIVTPADLATSLQEFVKTFPSSAHAAGFGQAVVQKDAWNALHDWRDVVQSWSGDLVPARPADASSRETVVNEFLIHHPNGPLNPQIQRYIDYLKGSGKIDSSWQEPLQNIQKNELLQLACVRTKDGKAYYLAKDTAVRRSSSGVAIDMIVSENMDDKPKVKGFREEDGVSSAQASPQRILLDEMIDAASRMRATTTFLASTWQK